MTQEERELLVLIAHSTIHTLSIVVHYLITPQFAAPTNEEHQKRAERQKAIVTPLTEELKRLTESLKAIGQAELSPEPPQSS